MNTINRLRYLRVSLINACNLNCFYCRPAGTKSVAGNDPAVHTLFEKSIELLCQLGVRKVRFTGGEPTLYKRLPELIAFTKGIDPSITTAITTNGILLEQLSPKLADAGLDAINISLDTLSREQFRAMTTADAFDKVMRGITAAIKHIPVVKLNCVLIDGVNDHEAEAMIAFANRLGVDIRFIEYMPTKYASDKRRGYLSNEQLRQRLPYQLAPMTPDPASAARYFTAPELGIRVGFISPVSHPFCAGCDRLRLTSEGKLHGCLFSHQGLDLFSLLKEDSSQTIAAIKQLVASKTYRGCAAAYDDERFQVASFDWDRVQTPMILGLMLLACALTKLGESVSDTVTLH